MILNVNIQADNNNNISIRSYVQFGKGVATVLSIEDEIESAKFNAATEVEAILKAVEYILTQLKETK